MLELKKINKSYTTATFKQHALKDVSISFKTNEFVAILGHSGSGKTTLLNMIGGLDRYDKGDLVINSKSTKNFKDKDWDAYRNNCIGFVFQSYNLISHITVLANVEMCMTLSGVSIATKRKRALEALEKVGIKDHAHKKPNQLSGGQMQRVAIARALVNDPDIILADEPTGALDSKTSVQIMELIKEIAKEKLVIMVTHNSELAHTYANRIIELKDGEVLKDSRPVKVEAKKEKFNIRRTSMNFLAALKLSFNNIKTKKGRTLITAFASSIGIIGIALILALSNGLQIQLDRFQRDTLINLPIIIAEQARNLDGHTHTHNDRREDRNLDRNIYVEDSFQEQVMHRNIITEEYLEHLRNIDQRLITNISYTFGTNVKFLVNAGGKITEYDRMISGMNFGIPPGGFPDIFFLESTQLMDVFEVLHGRMTESKDEVVIFVDGRNVIDRTTLIALGIEDTDELTFEELMSHNFEIVVPMNDVLYTEITTFGNSIFIQNTNFEEVFNHETSIRLNVVGIVKPNEEFRNFVNGSGIAYSPLLTEHLNERNIESEIVRTQKAVDYNVFTGQPFATEEEKNNVIKFLGGSKIPVAIGIYPRNFDSKEQILEHLRAFNEGRDEVDKIIYTDYAEMISSLSASLMNGITFVLIGFSAISLIVSSIMIGIITYISVLERTKEIGILRALGARKKDISRVFNAETFIIGTTSGLIGITIAYLLTFPVNRLIYNLTSLRNAALLDPIHALILILISVTLTLIGGFIPAKMASKKDPVIALRTE